MVGKVKWSWRVVDLRLRAESEDYEFVFLIQIQVIVLLFLSSTVGFLSGLVCIVLPLVLIDFKRATWCVIFV